MSRHRAWIAAIALWPAALYAAQQAQIVQLSPFLPIYCLACALSFLLVWRLRTVPLQLSLGAPAALFLVLRATLPYESADGGLATVVTELLAVCVTVLLSLRVGRDIEEFEAAVERSMWEDLPASPEAIDVTQGAVYSELRRARSFERPLTFLAISAADIGREKAHELIAEVQRQNLARYVSASIAAILHEELRDYDIVSFRDDHIVTVLPETGAEQARELTKRIRAACREGLGVELEIGTSSFPDQEYTLEKLLKRAESDMNDGMSAAIAQNEAETEKAKHAGWPSRDEGAGHV